MENVFLHLVNMSITAGWLVLAVVVLRLVFRRAPKWIHCLLWVLVAVRLVCPFSIESVLSLIPSAETVPVDTFLYETPVIHSGLPPVDAVVNPVLSDSFAPQPTNSVNPMQVLSILAAYAWAVGMALMLVYALVTTLRLKWRVRESVRLQRNVYQCDRIATPFILGIIRPRIYLPTTLTERDTLCVVAHEEAHIRRRDHWWKPLGFLLLTVYWFNPLLWLGYVLLCRDIEAACDERVIRDMDVAQRKAYSETLLACSAPRHMITACPLAFGETGVKSRIKSVLNYKKPAFWLIVVAVIASVVVAVCLLTNPKTTVSDELDAYLTHVILEQNYSEEHTGDAYPTEAHTVFGTAKKDGKTVVYGMVLYEEYYLDENGELQVQSGSHIPTVITVDVEGNGYSLVEYWIPRDGTDYPTDIRKKYPIWYWRQTDTQRHIDEHQQKTLADAKKHFNLNEEPAADAVVTKQNTWQTLGHPMSYEEASKVSGGHPLADYNKEKLQGFLRELEWRNDTATAADQLFDAYFSLDGVTRYYVSLDTWGESGYLYDGERYAILPEEQLGNWDFLLADGGSTIKATHVLYGYFAEWNKAERHYVLDVVQADDAALVGKKIRVNVQSLYGKGLPYIGRVLMATYDGTVLGDTVYAKSLAAPDEDTLNLNTSTLEQSGTITGKVIFVTDKALLLNCYDKEQFDVVWVRYGDKYPELNPQLNEEYTVGFNGQVMETYPPQVMAQTMNRVSSTPLNNGFISEERAVEIAIDHWKVRLDEPDMETGYYTTVYVMEMPTADNPRYKMGYREVDVQDEEPQNSALFFTMEIDAVTGAVVQPGGTTASNTTVSTTQKTTTTQVVDTDANTFVGKVTQVTGKGGTMLMECYDTSKFTKVSVSLRNFPEMLPKVGEEYVVTHDGNVMETYPPQIVAVSVTPVSSTPTINRTETETTTKQTTASTTSKPTASTKPPVSADGEFSGWRGDSFIVSPSLAADIEEPRVLVVKSLEEMNDLFEKNHFYHEGTMSETYDSSYFERNILLLVYYSSTYCSDEPRVVDVRYGDDRNSLRVWLDIYIPYMSSPAFGSWLLATSVDREAAANITTYDAYVRGGVPLSYFVAPYENAPTWGNIKSAPETWRDSLGEEEFELAKVLNRLNWVDLGTQVNESTFVGTFNLHNVNYYVSSDYTLICTEKQVANLTKEDGDYFRALFKPRDDLRYLPPYWTQLTETIQNSKNTLVMRNCWHTFSRPLPRAEAVAANGGYTLKENGVKQLKTIVDEARWKFGPDQYDEFLCDAYFSFDGSRRYYVYLDTSIGSFVYQASQYFTLTEKQCDIIKELMTGSA